MLKTFTTTLNILFIGVLLVVSGLFVATLFPLPGNIEAKIVQSGSMEPSIAVGALVVIKPSQTYGVGDVITFGEDTKSKIPTTHRIESVHQESGKTYYTTKGDANEEADNELVPHTSVIGKVVVSVPYAGFVLDFARQPLGFGLLIGLPALIVIVDELANIFLEVKKLRGPKRHRPALSERSSGRPQGSTRPFPQAQVGFADIRAIHVRRRVSEDMFIRTRLPAHAGRGALMLIAAFGLSVSVAVGSVGSTFSYFSDIERSLGNLLRAGEWGPPPEFEIFLLQGNPSCGGITFELEEKLEPVPNGVTVLNVAGFGTITVTVTDNEAPFSWSSDFGIDAVIAKGGPNANVYEYDPESLGDTGLQTPTNDNNAKLFGLSHISFCYDADVQAEALRFAPEPLGRSPSTGEAQVLGTEVPEEVATTTPQEPKEEAASSTPAVPAQEPQPPALPEEEVVVDEKPAEEPTKEEQKMPEAEVVEEGEDSVETFPQGDVN